MTEYKDVEQHAEVRVSVHGKRKVAFVTKVGWLEDISFTVDFTNRAKGVEALTHWLKELEPAPFENSCDNEEYVDRANNDIQNIIGALDESLTCHVDSTVRLTISSIEGYEVLFGR